MFTNNYKALRKLIFSCAGYGNSAAFTEINGGAGTMYAAHAIYSDVGNWMKYGRCGTLKTSVSNVTEPYSLYAGVYFGSGSTPATEDDYSLESVIESGLTVTSPSALGWIDDGNGKHSAVADFILRNTTETDIVVSEVGLFTPVLTASVNSYNTYTTYHNALMRRDVLDEPMTIPAGESKLVTYKLTFNQAEG